MHLTTYSSLHHIPILDDSNTNTVVIGVIVAIVAAVVIVIITILIVVLVVRRGRKKRITSERYINTEEQKEERYSYVCIWYLFILTHVLLDHVRSCDFINGTFFAWFFRHIVTQFSQHSDEDKTGT